MFAFSEHVVTLLYTSYISLDTSDVPFMLG